ncbi:MAG: hypothetical protein ABH919_02215 [bacterium]
MTFIIFIGRNSSTLKTGGKLMETKRNGKIGNIINSRGWNLYEKGPEGAEVEKGPVKSLLDETAYTILPVVKKDKSEKAIKNFTAKHRIRPQIILPDRAAIEKNGWSPFSLGRRILVFSGEEEETTLSSGEKIPFVGIELQTEEVRLFAQDKVFMPYDIFIEALSSLPDIANLREK